MHCCHSSFSPFDTLPREIMLHMRLRTVVKALFSNSESKSILSGDIAAPASIVAPAPIIIPLIMDRVQLFPILIPDSSIIARRRLC